MKYLVTTAIDYTNDVIHLGHAYQKVLADAYTRLLRQNYGNSNVSFVTGTDEYGQKNQKEAKKNNLDPQVFVDNIALLDQKEQDSLLVSYNRFIRTTDLDHQKTAQEFFKKSYDNGFIYEGNFEGKYCEGCEEYKTEKNLKNDICPLHPTREIIKTSEKNYFFKWSYFKDYLKEIFDKNPDFVKPKSKFNEMYSMIDEIEDIPVSRLKKNLSWGIECPIDQDHVLYVWFDALINYYTFAKNSWQDEDLKIIHFLGKDNAKFHALLWPAMLRSVDLRIPSQIYVNSFLSVNGQKISKSFGNVIRPSEIIKDISVEALRYYLLKFGPLVDDSDFSQKHLTEIYNGELANGLGNTVSRVFSLAKKISLKYEKPVSLFLNLNEEFLKDFRPDKSLETIFERISEINKDINHKEVWKIQDERELEVVLKKYLDEIYYVLINLNCYMPEITEEIIKSQTSGFTKTNFFPRVN